ncbi:MAG TPA: ABC transporter ATP-binding protein [Gaiellaceae bacterium]|nr:ABC transporter ATP-binding protein [Gaiellaceae bacterium]
MKPLAELKAVSKSFGRIRALDGLDLAVADGEIVGLLGPNGAGKTTAIGILLGLRRPDRGEARLFGRDPRDLSARRCVGCTPQETSFPVTLRVREVVDLVRAHFRAPHDRATLLERFRLDDLEQRQIGGLSGGQRRRLACALAFAGDPALVLLDEPSSGLDVESRLGLWETIRVSGCSVLLTTHSFEEAEALATRVVVLHEGRAVASGSPTALDGHGNDLRSTYLTLTRPQP